MHFLGGSNGNAIFHEIDILVDVFCLLSLLLPVTRLTMLCQFELFLAITSALATSSSSTVVKLSDQRLLQSCHLLGGAPTPAHSCVCLGFLVAQTVKNLPAMQETQV